MLCGHDHLRLTNGILDYEPAASSTLPFTR